MAMAVVVLIWGLGPPITKLITAPPLVTVSTRFWIAAPLTCLLSGLRGRPLSAAVLRATAPAGALFGLNLLCVVGALQYTSVAVLTVLLALQPGLVILVAGPALGERATPWHIACTAVGVLGVAIVVLGGNPQVRGSGGGILLAVLSVVTFTAYYVSNRLVRVSTEIDAVQWMAGVTLVAALAVTPVALAVSTPDDYRALGGTDWLYLAFITVLVGMVGHTLMSWAHRYIAATRSSLYLLGMNVVAICGAWPINGENIRPVQALGGAVVLAAVGAVIMPAAVPGSSKRPKARPLTQPP